MAKPFHAGKAAMDGMISAMLAERGFTGPQGILEPDSEYVHLLSREYDSAHLTDKLGRRYHILNNTFKLHAACLLLHPVIDGLLSIKEAHDLKPQMIEKIELEVAPLCLSVTDRPNITSAAEGKFSIHFCSALAVTKGKVGGGEFSDETVKDRAIRILMQKVAVRTKASMKETEARVVVHLSEGLGHRRHVSVPRGDPRKPVGFDEILGKFKSLNGKTFSDKRIEEIANTVRNLDEVTNIAGLVGLCRRPDRLTA